MGFWDYFFDPLLRGPTMGCMLMCYTTALLGVIVYVRNACLMGEVLSHASYPGVILGSLLGGCLGAGGKDEGLQLFVLVGGGVSCLLAFRIIHFLTHRLKVSSDVVLCTVLSAFFGVGVAIISYTQFSSPFIYRRALNFLYGQVATLGDFHIFLYLSFAIVASLLILFFFKEIQITAFDREYAKAQGVPTKLIEGVMAFLIVFGVVIGIRSVGVVLISAMLIAPPIGARMLTHRLKRLFPLAAFLGLFCGFLGNYLSLEVAFFFGRQGNKIHLPTGPMIVLVALLVCFLLLLFSSRGLIVRMIKQFHFRCQRAQENVLKWIWRKAEKKTSKKEMADFFKSDSPFFSWWILSSLVRKGWLTQDRNTYLLSSDGAKLAARIVRLHRLWEVYLVEDLGMMGKWVHDNAEEMEHVINSDIEKELVALLDSPSTDPHNQPIPSDKETL